MARRTLYDFKPLSAQQQYDVVFTEGTYIDAILEEKTRYALYAVDLFFVELEYDVANNKIVGKTSFVSGRKLDRYSKFNS